MASDCRGRMVARTGLPIAGPCPPRHRLSGESSLKSALRAEDLLDACVAAAHRGDDFPTVWESVLKTHPLVAYPPVQRMVDGRPRLNVILTTGERLVYDSPTNTYSLR
jgi:hypothetical protein